MHALDATSARRSQHPNCDALAHTLDQLEAEWIATHRRLSPDFAIWNSAVGNAVDRYRAAVRKRNDTIKIKLRFARKPGSAGPAWQSVVKEQAVKDRIAHLELDLEIGTAENLRTMVDQQEALRLAKRMLCELEGQWDDYAKKKTDRDAAFERARKHVFIAESDTTVQPLMVMEPRYE